MSRKTKQNKNKKDKSLYTFLKNNIVRKWSNAFNGTYDLNALIKSQIYSFFHLVYGSLICFIIPNATNNIITNGNKTKNHDNDA